jgi:1-deoxy-D-xylulose-5-phosphate reductoisomerase
VSAAAPRREPPSAENPRGVTILGATGSVGGSTLALIAEAPERYRVEAVTANRDADGLARIARATGARLAVVADPAAYGALKDALAGSGTEAAAGPEALVEAAANPAGEWVMAAIVGAAGLEPTLAAVRRGAMVALANKECLVCAGALFTREVAASGAVLLPVDSEHNAIFQALTGGDPASVERLILTASGGPFRTATLAEMAAATPERAVKHPNWSMGAKISVDSATMMNKGLELIEARHLFGLPEDRIDVLIHPQSVVHSLAAFTDGSVLAQLGEPDMRVPIAHALGWPARLRTTAARLDLAARARLDFEHPDPERFPALPLARAALRAGGAAPTILNAANEAAVAAFLGRRIGFLDIAAVVAEALGRLSLPEPADIAEALACDALARREAAGLIEARPRP